MFLSWYSIRVFSLHLVLLISSSFWTTSCFLFSSPSSAYITPYEFLWYSVVKHAYYSTQPFYLWIVLVFVRLFFFRSFPIFCSSSVLSFHARIFWLLILMSNVQIPLLNFIRCIITVLCNFTISTDIFTKDYFPRSLYTSTTLLLLLSAFLLDIWLPINFSSCQCMVIINCSPIFQFLLFFLWNINQFLYSPALLMYPYLQHNKSPSLSLC